MFLFSQLNFIELNVEFSIIFVLQKEVLNIGRFVTHQIPIRTLQMLLIIRKSHAKLRNPRIILDRDSENNFYLRLLLSIWYFICVQINNHTSN